MTCQAQLDLSSTPLPQPIDRNIYGHFLESAFYGNIEGGVLDEGSPLAVADDGPLQGCRADVLEACAELGVPVLRWPGGNFTSPYWWRDGTGPRDRRPRRLELAWGSEESNRFGTPEFLAWADAVGAEPYLAHSCRDVDDAVRWVEYTNYRGTTEMARLRAEDGHPEPYGVRYWGLGNEVYGPWQMGHRPVGRYVEDAREHARFMRAVDPSLSFVAVGWDREEWTDAVVAGLGEVADYVSVHHYGASLHLVDPSVAEFEAVVGQSLFFERALVSYSQLVAEAAERHGVGRPPAIAMDEWNMRHLEPASWPEPQPGADGGVAPRELTEPGEETPRRVNRHSPRTLADALFYAGVFHAMHRTAQLPVPVAMANTVNLVNANGLLNVRPEGLVRTTTYFVWDLYQNHFGTRPTAVGLRAPSRWAQARLSDERRLRGELLTAPTTVPDLDVSAALSEDGSRLTVAVINRSPDTDLTTQLTLDGRTDRLPGTVEVRTLGADADDLFAVNTIDDPGRVTLSPARTVELDQARMTFGAHSITLLTFDLR
ncbi:alpha-N-arabinofuranosidase [Auraticoccus sp. F435]|uniref:non-reducing end alpha-L-arabinofuranosidase n=1 Tax=Auraticoccus cholistanensis TaxID=2656650 RepID=A0A6A9V0E3_9ACTN|nr:alpha-L-arabinofuranosidase C-terminal domain-containing protein [Auraticoccus cholistanensis]MVA75270.1 alpha-N-arabinofuranosidase [Auraticoccus cholistanensis]